MSHLVSVGRCYDVSRNDGDEEVVEVFAVWLHLHFDIILFRPLTSFLPLILFSTPHFYLICI